MNALAAKLAGKFIVLDGPDGSGKSTQIALLRDHLAGVGLTVELVYDPGATEVGEKIRAILLGKDTARIGATCEMLRFMAARAQLVEERVRPALSAGKVVLCDRFISSTLAYQGASGLDPIIILDVGETAVQGIWPDLTVILDVPVEVTRQRLGDRGAPVIRRKVVEGSDPQLALFGDRVESRSDDFHESVRRNFRRLVKDFPHPAVCIRADRPREEVFQDVLESLVRTFCAGRE